ncbi:hypothetical protein A5724_19000 [Mycobacterium sp. ACS1612]|nr:hypothetical protein A5724_19000 [Mycobacterium sp. ACS1612]
MANIITADHDTGATDVMISKGLTSVFLDAGAAGQRWHVLGYAPNREHLLPSLAEFRAPLETFPVAACPEQPFADCWSTLGLRTDGAKCPNHAVFLHNLTDDDKQCCHLCNN